MKWSILLILVSLSTVASAAPIACRAQNNPYRVLVANDHKTADVELNGQPVQFGKLHCEVPESAFTNGPFLLCRSKFVADAGYTAAFSYVHRSLIINVRLEEMWIGGSHLRGILPCVEAQN
jgi:hypothetical protein